MARFVVYRNANTATRAAVPYSLGVQSDLIAELGTRVVVPLYTAAAMKGRVLKTLTPVLDVAGKAHVMVTPQLAGVSRDQLGPQVADLSAQRDAIMAALDFLMSGI